MRKINVLGLGNQEEINWIIVKKEDGFFEWLNKILIETFGSVSPDVEYEETSSKKDKVITRKMKIEDCTDIHEYYDAEDNSRIDVFYGKEKVFIMVFTSLKNRKNLIKNLDKFSEFQE